VDSCVTTFQGGGGATENGPWINTTNNTWNARTKLAVQGSITWSSAANAVSLQGTKRTLTTNDLPKGATTGTFPISPNDPAYQYDRNPNSITAHSFSWTVPANPSPASGPSCTPLGPIGMTLDGVVLLNALDAGGRDAVAHEIQDGCNGHPQQSGIYHYHSISTCLMGQASQTPNSSTLVGYALDGYGIYIERDAKGDLPTDADLDACHGRTSTVVWDGKQTSIYHYDATLEYPYTVGCFRGTRSESQSGPVGPPNGAPGDPPGAGPP
jgi:hypothetical protein